MIFDDHDLAGAVFIFSEERELIRELNYSEFEALLDGYVPSVELANRELNGIYVEINSDYHVRNAVCFLVKFSSRGFIEQSVPVQLYKLALHAKKGPNLGAGPINLACASQCPIKHMANFLWDPDLKKYTEFKAVVEAVSRNRMSIQFHPATTDSKAPSADNAASKKADLESLLAAKNQQDAEHKLRDDFAQKIREQRLKNAMMLREREQSVNELKQQYNARIEEYRLMLDEHKHMLGEARQRNTHLQEMIDGQAEKIKGLREYFEVKLEQAESGEHDHLVGLVQAHQVELETAIDVATRELKELLEMREVEILYRNDQEAKLHEEIERLRDENTALIGNSGDHLLAKMLESGISFMTFQPGAGHITLPLSAVPRYMENPVAYVADYCGVSEKHYNAWLEHYHVPVCRSQDHDGNMCGNNINRIEAPADFILGESDCCFSHRQNKTPHLKVAGGS